MTESLVESWDMPKDVSTRVAGNPLSDRKWQSLLGMVISGKYVREAMKELQIGRGQFEATVRADKDKKKAWDEAKLAALRHIWDNDTVDEILAKVAMNESGGYLKRVIEDMGLDPASFYTLMMRAPDIRDLYEEAREIQAEIQADEMRQIAEDGANDSYVDDRGRVRVDHDVLGRSKLRVDTLKWVMSKLHYKRFGDRIQQDQNINLVVDHAERLANARKRSENRNGS